MIAILENPELRHRASPISVEEYHQLGLLSANGRRTELICGMILEKMSKSPLHSAVQRRLLEIIQAVCPATHHVRKDEPLTFADSEPEPDIAVVAGAASDFDAAHPKAADLVVEVAVTSVASDREYAGMYAEASVPEYWIVLAAQKAVEIYRRPVAGRYTEIVTIRGGAVAASSAVPTIRVETDRLFS